MARAKNTSEPREPPPWSLAAALLNPRRRTALVIDKEDAEEFFRECGRFTNLRKLELKCGLERVPRKVFNLTRLRVIDFSHNRLKFLSKYLINLKYLDQVNLAGNELRRLPRAFGQLTRLNSLELSANALDRLPKEIFQCKALRFLGLGGNKLRTLPKEVGQLTRLEWLSVNGNALRRCPPEVGQLRRLRTLILSDNRLVEIPKSIGQLKDLSELWVGGNPLSDDCKSWLKDRFGVFPAGVTHELE